MQNTYHPFATWEQYIIYLRKSRQDDPRETIEEVLLKHESMLQEYAIREFGHKIPEANIYREVVSGESIDEREEIKEVLVRISDPNIKGVLVVEPSRLSRGDLTDCGRLINALRYTKTQVVTPYMTYDLDNKMERKFFQDELLRGNDYLEYTKEILWRGRIAAAKRGCYITGGPSPFGYKKVKIGKDWTLEIVPEEAELVRQIFDWYVRDGLTCPAIARKLGQMGIKTRYGYAKWNDATIRQILSNRHYIGLIVFNKKKLVTLYENGEKVKRHVKQKEEDIIIAKGLHKAIIDDQTFEAASKLIAPNPKVKEQYELKNPLSGILRCGKCGATIIRGGYSGGARYVCRAHQPRCCKSIPEGLVIASVIETLEKVELPALQFKVNTNEGSAVKIQQRLISSLQAQLIEFEKQEENLFELVETKAYTAEMFNRRYAALSEKIEACRKELETARRAMPKEIDYKERAETLEKTIELLKDPSASATEKNNALKLIIDRIEFTTPGIGKRGVKDYTFSLKVFINL